MGKKKILATADCETDPFRLGRIPKPFVWGLYYKVRGQDNYFKFNSTEKFVNFIKEKELLIYVHNGGKFDFHFLLDFVQKNNSVKVINNTITEFKIGASTFRDSLKILPIRLSQYQKDDIRYSKLEKKFRGKYENEINDYLKSDCVFLYNIVNEFVSEYGRAITLPSAAMQYFNKNFLTHKPKITHKAFYDDFKKFYFGGRTQCFKKGVFKEKLEYYDINSSYPYAMEHLMPWGSSYSVYDNTPSEKEERNLSFIEGYGYLEGHTPIRDPKKFTLTYPIGFHEFNMVGYEFNKAVECGFLHSYKIKKVVVLNSTIDMSGYVDHFFKQKAFAKKCGDKAKEIISKLFLNSLYGKFAMNPEKFMDYFTLDNELIEWVVKRYVDQRNNCEECKDSRKACPTCKKLPEMVRKLNDQCFLVRKGIRDESKKYLNVATGAAITAFARSTLLDGLSKCTNAYYCDTDSIICSNFEKSLVSEQLGAWSVEGKYPYVEGAFAGRKMYAVKDALGHYKTASKGARLKPRQIYDIARGNKVVWYNPVPQFSTFKEPEFISKVFQMT